jgi:hypothetical protein
MAKRFEGLEKIPRQPAARLLALANARLGVKVDSPAAAPVHEVLAELDGKSAVVDMLRLLAVSLPPRERVWWACLAARDLVAAGKAPATIVEAVEAWVWEPSEETMIRIRRAIDAAESDDETVLCGNAAMMSGGKLGPEELAQFDAPPGGSEAYALVMNAQSLGIAEAPDLYGHYLVDRALDIARGGQGDLPPPVPPAKPADAPRPQPKTPRARTA